MLPTAIRAEFIAERAIFYGFIAYIAAALGISWASGYFFNPLSFALEFGSSILALFILWLLLAAITGALRTAPQAPLAAIIPQLKSRLTPRLWVGMALIPLLLVFIQCFLAIKNLLPRYFEFVWDVPLADLDRWLHGGTDPWFLLQPLFDGRPVLTRVLETIYSALWLLAVLLFPVLVILIVQSRQLRLQYFYTYLLSWALLGNVLAGLLLSGGPCFYDIFTGDAARFAPLVDYLRTHSDHALSAMGFRDVLLKIFESRQMHSFGGISAMPSMHIAMATLFACVALRLHRGFFLFALFFLLAMQVASVHLGWHYAIDGYVSMVLTLLLWHAAGWLTRRSEPSR